MVSAYEVSVLGMRDSVWISLENAVNRVAELMRQGVTEDMVKCEAKNF